MQYLFINILVIQHLFKFNLILTENTNESGLINTSEDNLNDSSNLLNRKQLRGISLYKLIEENDARHTPKPGRYSCRDKEDEGHYEHPDCRKYWHCLYVGTIFEAALERKCPVGTMFHPVERTCEISTMLTCHGWYKSIFGKDFKFTTTSTIPNEIEETNNNKINFKEDKNNEYYGYSNENSYEISNENMKTFKIDFEKPTTLYYSWYQTISQTIFQATTKSQTSSTTKSTTVTTTRTTKPVKNVITSKTTINSTPKTYSYTYTTKTSTFKTTTTTRTSTKKTEPSTTSTTQSTTTTEADDEEEIEEDDEEIEDETESENYENDSSDYSESNQEVSISSTTSTTNPTTITTQSTTKLSSRIIIPQTIKDESKKYNVKYTTIFSSNLLEKLRNFESNEKDKTTSNDNRNLAGKNYTILTSGGKKTFVVPGGFTISTNNKIDTTNLLENRIDHHTSLNENKNLNASQSPEQIDIIKKIFALNNRSANQFEHLSTSYSDSTIFPTEFSSTRAIFVKESATPQPIPRTQPVYEDDDVVQGEEEEEEENLVEQNLEKEDFSMLDSELLLNLQLNSNINSSPKKTNPNASEFLDNKNNLVENHNSEDYSDQSQAIYSESASSSSSAQNFNLVNFLSIFSHSNFFNLSLLSFIFIYIFDLKLA